MKAMDAMRLAIYTTDSAEAERLSRWTEEDFARRGGGTETVLIGSAARFREEFRPGRFGGFLVALGDTEGFLAARCVREADRGCRVVLIDDTERYAIRGLRIHLTDFLLRPLVKARFFAALDRVCGG